MADPTRESDFDRVKGAVSLKAFAAAHLQRARAGHPYVCPFCESGGHGNGGDSAFSIEGNDKRFTCFSCGEHGDVYDLAAQVYGIDPTDRAAQLQAVAEWAGIEITAKPKAGSATLRAAAARVAARPKADAPTWEPPADEGDYAEGRAEERAYVLQARERIADPVAVAYLEGRGWTLEEAKALGMGYDPRRKRLVTPWKGSDYYHVDRDVTGRSAINKDYPKNMKPRRENNPGSGKKGVGPQPLYNPDALEEPAFIVVEGVFDALALEVMGIQAVCAGGIGGRNKLKQALNAIDGDKPVAVFAYDRDATGEQATKKAVSEWQAAHLPYRVIEWPADLEGKDIDEMRVKAPERTKAFLTGVVADAVAQRDEAAEEAYKAATKALKVVDVAEVVAQIFTCEGLTRPTPTGLRSVDKALGGGLPAGLVTLGAVSSVGKTTLALQIADSIAESGRAVLFVTIEQSARELVAKSLARLTATAPGNRGLAATASELADPKRRAAWNTAESERLIQACEIYTERVAPRVNILEGIEQPSVADVATLARSIAERDGEPPVVFIDYLQLLAAPSDRDDDKRATDKNVMALRHLARDLKTPVVVISSLNRASYSAGVTLDSFKESGAIEYGSDILLGLQPAGMYAETEEVAETKVKGKARKIMREHKAKAQRPCELVVLKNRNGATTDEGVPLTFDAPHSLWLETPDAAPSYEDFPTE